MLAAAAREEGFCSVSIQIYRGGTTGLLPWHGLNTEWWELDVCFRSAWSDGEVDQYRVTALDLALLGLDAGSCLRSF